jgi:predicted transcriptional regulator
MDNLEYVSHTQTLIGQKQRTLLDTDTGEQIVVDQITKRVYGTKNFWKVYLMDFLSILGIFDSKQVDVFIYIVENTSQADNRFIGTYKKIAEDVNVSQTTIATIMKKLQTNNFIKKVQNGCWLVNPNILMKGNDTKRQVLLSYFESDKPIDEITVARTKRKPYDHEPQKAVEATETPKAIEAPTADKNGTEGKKKALQAELDNVLADLGKSADLSEAERNDLKKKKAQLRKELKSL